MTLAMTRRRLGPATLIVALMLALAAGPAGAATATRTSFEQAQSQFMCVLCHEPLNEARSDEAYTENAYVRQLIAHGDTLAQIKHEMVLQYGPGVLAVPPAHGFSLLVFIIPGAVIVLGLALIAVTIPRWRRRATVQAAQAPTRAGPGISDEDARRLDAELARQP
jgi:cytochrome c-type biogenesis protein CcmH/NrfF